MKLDNGKSLRKVGYCKEKMWLCWGREAIVLAMLCKQYWELVKFLFTFLLGHKPYWWLLAIFSKYKTETSKDPSWLIRKKKTKKWLLGSINIFVKTSLFHLSSEIRCSGRSKILLNYKDWALWPIPNTVCLVLLEGVREMGIVSSPMTH